MPILMTTPDISAETCDGAAACAGGSQKCNGTRPALTPKPTSASARTALRAAPAARVPCGERGKLQSPVSRASVANIAKSASVAVCVATM